MRNMFHRKSYSPVPKKENTEIFYLDECVLSLSHAHTHTHTHTHLGQISQYLYWAKV